MRAARRWCAAIGVALCATAGCNATHADKSGVPTSGPAQVLTMVVPSAGDPEAAFFADTVERLSNGSLRVSVNSTAYSDVDPIAEEAVVGALARGRFDLGFVAGREFAQAGDPGFVALQEPFLITTSTATAAVTRSPVAREVLAGLARQHLTGLALVPNEPRQLVTTAPLFGADLNGASIRIIDNDQTAALIHALGGVPVQGLTSSGAGNGLTAHTLDGVESSPTSLLENAYIRAAPYVSAEGLFPKINTLVASDSAWDGLPQAERTVLQQAALDTRDHAIRAVPQLESHELTQLCAAGGVIDEPSAPVLARLEQRATGADPTGAAAGIAQHLLDHVSGLGPAPTAVPIPASCHIAHTAKQAQEMVRLLAHQSNGAGTGSFPTGTFVTTDSVADFRRGGQVGEDWNKPITFTTRLLPNGRFTGTQKPDYPDQGPTHGHYEVDGDSVTFTFTAGQALLPETTRWSYYDGELTFTVVDVPDTASRVIYTAHPWRRVR